MVGGRTTAASVTSIALRQDHFDAALKELRPTTLDWPRTVRNVVRYAGEDASYQDVERYLKETRLL